MNYPFDAPPHYVKQVERVLHSYGITDTHTVEFFIYELGKCGLFWEVHEDYKEVGDRVLKRKLRGKIKEINSSDLDEEEKKRKINVITLENASQRYQRRRGDRRIPLQEYVGKGRRPEPEFDRAALFMDWALEDLDIHLAERLKIIDDILAALHGHDEENVFLERVRKRLERLKEELRESGEPPITEYRLDRYDSEMHFHSERPLPFPLKFHPDYIKQLREAEIEIRQEEIDSQEEIKNPKKC